MSDGFTPVIVTSRGDLAGVMAGQRRARAETCHDADHRIGFHTGYTAKLEHPNTKSGKRGLRISHAAECWLEAFGLVLVVMRRDQATALGAVVAPAARTQEAA